MIFPIFELIKIKMASNLSSNTHASMKKGKCEKRMTQEPTYFKISVL